MAVAGEREASLGITEFLTPGPGFLAITKLRFTDFIVHEVSLSGHTVKLEALADVPAAPAADAASAPGPDAPDDAPAEPVEPEAAAEAALAAVVGLEVAQALCRLQASAKAATSFLAGISFSWRCSASCSARLPSLVTVEARVRAKRAPGSRDTTAMLALGL